MANPFINLSPELINDGLRKNNRRIRRTNDKINDAIASGDNDEVARLNEVLLGLQDEESQLNEALDSFAEKCTSRDSDLSWMKENIDPCKTYINSEAYAYWKKVIEVGFDTDPCGESTVAGISKAIQEVFARLKTSKKYFNKFIDPALNAVSGLESTISNAVELISGIMRNLLQRARNFFIGIIREQLETFFEETLPELASNIQSIALKQIIDTLFCKIGDIINGLGKLIGDFLFELIGNIVKFPFCAAEQFANSLINNIANRVDKALEPILGGIMSALGGITKMASNITSAIDFILGFENFLCSKGPECPEIKTRKALWWGGPQQEAADKFENFLDGLNLSDGEKANQLNRFDRWTGNFKLFGTNFNEFDGDVNDLAGCTELLGRCGPPKVQIFGGGGSGAAGDAIVNELGQIVGVDLTNNGGGYKNPPYVAFIDDCGNGGSYAAAHSVISNNVNVPIDRITFAPIGNPSGNPSGNDEKGIDENGKCVYRGKIFHEYDDVNNKNISLSASASFSVKSRGNPRKKLARNESLDDRTYIKNTRVDATRASLTNNKKHYRIEFDEPYDDDDYEIIIENVQQMSASGETGGVFQPIIQRRKGKPLVRQKDRFGFSLWFGRDAIRATRPKPVGGPLEEKSSEKKPSGFFIKEGNDYFLRTGGSSEGENFVMQFKFKWNDNPDTHGVAIRSIRIPDLPERDLIVSRNERDKRGNATYSIVVEPQKKYGPLIFDRDGGTPDPRIVDSGEESSQSDQQINFFDRDEFDANGSFLIVDSFNNEVVQNQIIDTGQPILFEPEIYLKNAPRGSLFATYVRSFVVITKGNLSTCQPGDSVEKIVITNPGFGYTSTPPPPPPLDPLIETPPPEIPPPDFPPPGIPEPPPEIPELTPEPTPEPPPELREYVGCFTDIEVLATGLGYRPDDEITITPDIEGLEVRVQINEFGQIIDMNVVERVCGVTGLPEIEINSPTGSGFKARPEVIFTRKEEFDEDAEDELDPAQIIQVIDCVLKPQELVGYVNGVPYYGPYHIHRGRKMVGAVHTNQPHDYIYDTLAESVGSSLVTTTSTTSTTPTRSTASTTSTTSTMTTSTTLTMTTSTNNNQPSSGGGGSTPPNSGGGGGYGY